jgi:ribosomal protein L11 methyltransferase
MKPEINPAFFMQKQLEIIFENVLVTQMDLLIAKLFELGVHGMEESTNGLRAYAYVDQLNEESLNQFSSGAGLTFSIHEVKEQNWNALWESNFEPVVIPGKVYVRAEFHPRVEGFDHDILITPKMSFGTGHHATTMMMMKLMLEIDLVGKKVIDFGSGTGILSILALKLGASRVEAIDNEPWSVENAIDNATFNNCSQVNVSLASDLAEIASVDVLLANINKSILIEHAASIFQHVIPGGYIIISGLLRSDYDDILMIYTPFLNEPINMLEEGEWIALVFKKPI